MLFPGPFAVEGLEGYHISDPLYTLAVILLSAGSALAAASLTAQLLKMQARRAFGYGYEEDTEDEGRELFYTFVAIFFFASVPVIWVLLQLLLRGEAITLGGM